MGLQPSRVSGPDRPIFVLGCPRSGTTLVQLMVLSHPRMAIPPETRFVLESYRQRPSFGNLASAGNRAALARWIVERPQTRFADLGLAPEPIVAEIVAGAPTLGSALATVLRAYAHRLGKPRWGDKRPAYYRDVATLRRLFPDAQFVHVVRDGRACVASLKRMTWWHQDSLAAMAMWAESIDYGRANRRRLPADTWHELSYERLVADPESELTRLCAFLGESYDPAMACPQEMARIGVPARKTWHARTREALNPARVASWQGELEPWELAVFEHVCGDRLREHGYPLASPAGHPFPAQLAGYYRVDAIKRASHRKRHLLDRLDDLRVRRPVAARSPAAV